MDTHTQEQPSTRPTLPGAVRTDWSGVVRHLHLTPRAFLPMQSVPSLTLVAGLGIEGDRYIIGRETGFYSHKPEEGRQLTLFEIETIWALERDHGIELAPEEHRRNVTVEGVPLTHLVGERFWLGQILLEATRLSIPRIASSGMLPSAGRCPGISHQNSVAAVCLRGVT